MLTLEHGGGIITLLTWVWGVEWNADIADKGGGGDWNADIADKGGGVQAVSATRTVLLWQTTSRGKQATTADPCQIKNKINLQGDF